MTNKQKKILIVDDEATQLRILESVVSRMGHSVQTAMDGLEALNILTDANCSVDLVILDLSMPKMSGIEVLKAIKPQKPELPIIILTAHAGLKKVVEAMKAGASDFISKPASAERIRVAMENAFAKSPLVGDLEPVSEAFTGQVGFDSIVGESAALEDSIRMAQKAASTSIPILISGESGVGKEVFAKAIHGASPRGQKPFIAVNCGAIPENLVESILFGHEKGSFTGANDRHIGKFEEANGGTLFLDEIGELPLDMQVKLLRAIQEGEIERIGGKETIKVDIRLLSATNRDLTGAIADGTFREDLFYRLNVFPLTLPPLRERRSDIALLTTHFIKIIAKSEGMKAKPFSPETLQLLRNYTWPGNIRQLQNAVFRAVVLSEGAEITPDDFPQILSDSASTAYDNRADGGTSGLETPTADDSDQVGGGLALFAQTGHIKTLEHLERDILSKAIAHYDGKLSEVARRLNIGRSTLYRKMEQYGLKK